MSISRIKPAGWAVNETLTAAQMNALDANVIKALDKTSAGDTLSGIIACAGVGRVVDVTTTGANADTTYAVGTTRNIRVNSSVNANRIYTLSATGAVTGDVVTIFCESSFTNTITVKDQASTSIFSLGNLSTNDGSWASFIYISGWRVFRKSEVAKMKGDVFTANGTWTPPHRGVTNVILVGWGGGGAGGHGGDGSSSINEYYRGGGGGGSAIEAVVAMPVSYGTTYTVTIGAGGSSSGAAGSNSSFGSVTFRGGPGGNYTTANAASTNVASGGGWGTTQSGIDLDVWSIVPANCGGYGHYVGQASSSGGSSPRYAGGVAGASGTSDGSYRGGGGGGGGAGGPGGVGGAGGAGGDGASASSGTGGVSGSSAGANTGAGGGGGGGGGCGSGGGEPAGAGGLGGSGQITVFYIST